MPHSNSATIFVKPLSSAFLFATITFFTGYAPVAGAQDSMPEEITVTARKRTETLQDVPATVTVFTENDIERSNITRAGDIALLTPGVSLVDAAEVGDTQVNIRGMNGARDAENSYALVIDGVTYTNPAALNREYSNLQQIEVLKGPQGAIYGRNASAGAFIITTQVPEDELRGQLKASGGEDTTYSLVGDIAGPITDSIRGSVMGEYFTSDGYYKNDFLNRDDITDNRENWALTGRLIFDIGSNSELDTKLRYGEVDASSITFNSIFHIPFFAEQGFGDAFYEDVNDHPFNFYNNVVHTNDQEATEFSAKWTTDFDSMTLTAWGLYSSIENQLGADGTSAAFGFFNADQPCIDTVAAISSQFPPFDPANPQPVNPPQYIGASPNFPDSVLGAYTPTACDGTQYQKRDQDDISFELRLASNNDSALQWMGGLYFLDIDREVAVNTGIDRLNAGAGYIGGSPIQKPFTNNPLNPTEQLIWDQFDTQVASVFGQLAYDFTDTFTMDLALRYDREKRKAKSKVPTDAVTQYIDTCLDGGVGGDPINPGLCANPGVPLPERERTFKQFQPKLSANWQPLDSTSFFASYGVGFRSGGFNNQGSAATVNSFINGALYNGDFDLTDPNNPIPLQGLCDPATAGCVESGRSRVGIKDDYEKETSSAFELGFKSNFADNALRVEGAAYYNQVDDMQFFEFIVGPFGLLRVVENIDEVDIFGIEGSVTWDAAEWLDLYVGANWNDTEIKKNTARPDTVGNDSPYTPDYTANLGAYLSFPVGNNLNFFTNLDVSAIGKTWFHVVQDQTRPIGFELVLGAPIAPGEYSVARRDAYALANLRLGFENEYWTAALWVTNLTDEEYLEENIPAPEFGGSFAHPGTLRRIGADFTWRF
jgi:iron complex outermembrane receptor protein